MESRKANASNGGYLNIDSKPTTTWITNNSLTGTPDYTGAEVVIRNSHFTLSRQPIISQSTTTITYGTTTGTVNYGFFIQNSIQRHYKKLELT